MSGTDPVAAAGLVVGGEPSAVLACAAAVGDLGAEVSVLTGRVNAARPDEEVWSSAAKDQCVKATVRQSQAMQAQHQALRSGERAIQVYANALRAAQDRVMHAQRAFEQGTDVRVALLDAPPEPARRSAWLAEMDSAQRACRASVEAAVAAREALRDAAEAMRAQLGAAAAAFDEGVSLGAIAGAQLRAYAAMLSAPVVNAANGVRAVGALLSTPPQEVVEAVGRFLTTPVTGQRLVGAVNALADGVTNFGGLKKALNDGDADGAYRAVGGALLSDAVFAGGAGLAGHGIGKLLHRADDIAESLQAASRVVPDGRTSAGAMAPDVPNSVGATAPDILRPVPAPESGDLLALTTAQADDVVPPAAIAPDDLHHPLGGHAERQPDDGGVDVAHGGEVTTPAELSTLPVLTDLQIELAHKEIKSIDDLNVGVHANEALKVQFADGTEAIYKPVNGEGPTRESIPAHTQAVREIASYRVAASLGFADLVPPTTLLETVDHGPGSLQQWVSDASQARPVGYYSYSDQAKMAVLDYVTGNTDRHIGNYLTSSDGRPIAIDNGLTHPVNARDPIRSDFVAAWLNRPLDPDLAASVRSVSIPQLSDHLTKLGVEESAVRGVLWRLYEIQENGKITGDSWPGKFTKHNWTTVEIPQSDALPSLREYEIPNYDLIQALEALYEGSPWHSVPE